MDLARELRNLKTQWKATSAAPPMNQLPDNEYVAIFIGVEIGMSKNNRLQAVTTFEIADGGEQGKVVKGFNGIGDEVGISFFKSYCQILGLEYPENIEELQDVMADFSQTHSGDIFNIKLVTKKGYQNLYVLGAKDTGDGDDVTVTNGVPEEVTNVDLNEDRGRRGKPITSTRAKVR